ncbi:MAG: hypothetical protein QOG07_3705 [Pseudonocardiales bacterium]|jgi:uncharacterized membrane protein HdeD (DUF308 family)|nr:protein of unknown function rane [Pseudonocardiales bacterium]MDT4981826.1 hypothetical protein [Pseudonocardiales bacterium]
MHGSISGSLALRGVLAVAVGLVSVIWPSVTLTAVVVLFAVYAFIDAGLQTARAFSSASAGPVFGHLLLGLLDLAAGVVALAWPGITALALVLVIAVWAFATGFLEIAAAFGDGETAGLRAYFVLSGLVSIALGVVLSASPDIGAVSLALVFGLFAIVYGVSQLVLAAQARKAGGDLKAMVQAAA